MQDQNYEAFKSMEKSEYEGKCIGIVDGKIVVSGKSIKKVIETLKQKFPNKELTIASVPRKNATFVL